MRILSAIAFAAFLYFIIAHWPEGGCRLRHMTASEKRACIERTLQSTARPRSRQCAWVCER